MKWPFVRRSRLENLQKNYSTTLNRYKHERFLILKEKITIQKIDQKEINRLNQELASELNSHREIKKKLEQTKDLWHKSLDHNDSFLKEIRKLEKELEETKDALKIAQEDLEKKSKNHLKTYAIFKNTKRKIYHILKESL